MTKKNLISTTEYAAFISYRHVEQDRQWAEWLIHALETYRVPNHLQKLGYPQRIGKVFRDEDELPLSSDLTDQIKQALTVSRNLIVICSPETPQSKWIAREIEMFQEQGKANRIHAFLIEGEPQTAFPNGLRFHRKNITGADGAITTIVEEHEPLAANVIPMTGVSKKQRDKVALLKLVAAIIGCSFDDLVQRDKAREKKKQNIQRTIFASIILLVSLGVFYWWDYNRLKIDYYEHMVTRWAVPEGRFPVSEDQASRRNKTYRFESRRNQVERVVLQNGLGYPRNNDEEFSQWNGGAQWHFFYDAMGKIRQVDVLGQTDKRLRQEDYSQDLRSISFKNDNRDVAQSSVISNLITESAQTAKSEITRHGIEYRKDGFIIKRQFTNNYGTPRSDATGVYGLTYKLNSNGLIIREGYLDRTGKGLLLKNGIAAIDYGIDAPTGRVNAITFRDEKNNLILGNSGVAKATSVYDERGNMTEVAYFGVDGKPVLSKDGYAKFTSVYDERGNELEIAFFGINNEPVLSGSGFAKAIREYDERGNRIAGTVYGVDGKPTLTADGFATIRRVFDARGNNTEIAYFGLKNKPVLHRRGYTKEINTFDVYGNITETQYLDLNGNQVMPLSD